MPSHALQQASTERSRKIRALLAAMALVLLGSVLVASDRHQTASAATAQTIYPSGTTPLNKAEQDSQAVELGVRFRVTKPGTVTAVRFYKSTSNKGKHTGRLWTSDGKVLASATFLDESASGWQTAVLSAPVAVKPGPTYVASYFASRGYYAQKTDTFARGRTFGNSTIYATTGTFKYGGGFPTNTWRNAEYYVDVMFFPSSLGGVTPPPATTTAQTPKPSASSSTATVTPTATSTSASATATATTTATSASSSPTSAPASTSVPPTGPPSTSFPDATTTGVPAGVVLKKVPSQVSSGAGWHSDSSGRVTIDKANTVLDGLDIAGAVSNNYTGLIVKNSKIRCANENDWCIALGHNSTIVDTEIGGGATGTTFGHAIAVWTGDTAAGNLIQRVNIHHQIHGLRVDGGTTLVDSYIHALPMGDPVLNVATGRTTTDDHTDGLMTTSGGNTVVRHNRFEGGNTACLFVQWDVTDPTAPKIGAYTVENNYFVNIHANNQDSSWGVAIENKGIVGPIIVRNNTFTRSSWTVGPITAPPGSTVTGNIYPDGKPAQ